MGGFSSMVVGWTHPRPKSNFPPDFDLEKIHRKWQVALEDRLNYHTQLTLSRSAMNSRNPRSSSPRKPWEGLAASFQQSRSFRSDFVTQKKTWQRPQGDRIIQNQCMSLKSKLTYHIIPSWWKYHHFQQPLLCWPFWSPGFDENLRPKKKHLKLKKKHPLSGRLAGPGEDVKKRNLTNASCLRDE